LNDETLALQAAGDCPASKTVSDNQRVDKHGLLSHSIEAGLAMVPLVCVGHEQIAIVVHHLADNLLTILVSHGLGIELQKQLLADILKSNTGHRCGKISRALNCRGDAIETLSCEMARESAAGQEHPGHQSSSFHIKSSAGVAP
ncbi:hypothetical protein K3Z87_19875, partial [Pseudomonas aeruginosa]|nr:hypothetical protein [Pseudomonas aeruginosa]